MDAQGFGSLFSGLMAGIQQGQQTQRDMQQKKDLLKLEQDKLKLQEREAQLNSATSLQTALIHANAATQAAQIGATSAENVATTNENAMNARNTETLQNNITTEGMRVSGSLAVEAERAKAAKAAAQVASTPQGIQTVDALVKRGLTQPEAISLVYKAQEEPLAAGIIKTYITAHAVSGTTLDFKEINQAIVTAENYKNGFGGATKVPTFDLGNIPKWYKAGKSTGK